MHPFPILERCLERDLIFKGQLIATAGTHAIMFTSDFSTTTTTTMATTSTSATTSSSHTKYMWPIFGAGPRSCAGIQVAKPVLKVSFSHMIVYFHKIYNNNNNNKIGFNERSRN